jgi:hypothetical protein
MWIILGVLLSFSALALGPFEQLKNVKILRILPDNVIMLNRGVEDGVMRNDHAKISNDTEGFSSRAICLKASSDVSYWRIYRVPKAEAFSLDYIYTLSGMGDQEIPYPPAKWRDQEQKIAEGEENQAQDIGVDPFTIKIDLPEGPSERDLIETVGPEKRKLFVEQTLNRDQLQRDLKDYKFSLYASPFTRQSINEGESLRYGFRGGNIASKYRLLTQFEQQETRLKDPLTKEEVSTRGTTGQVQFVIHHLTSRMSSLSLINYNSQRFSRLGTPKAHWQTGPIGFTWHLHDSKTWEYIDLSYVPLYDLRVTDIVQKDGSVKAEKMSGLRHGLRFGIKSKVNEKVSFENLLWVRPYQDIASWRIETDNLNLSNDLKLIFSLTDNLFFDYNLVFQRDKLWKKLSGLSETNTINSFNLRYDFNI